MDDKLQGALATILEKAVQGVDFAVDQAPDVVQFASHTRAIGALHPSWFLHAALAPLLRPLTTTANTVPRIRSRPARARGLRRLQHVTRMGGWA